MTGGTTMNLGSTPKLKWMIFFRPQESSSPKKLNTFGFQRTSQFHPTPRNIAALPTALRLPVTVPQPAVVFQLQDGSTRGGVACRWFTEKGGFPNDDLWNIYGISIKWDMIQIFYMEVSIIGDTPNSWMVFVRENRHLKWMMIRG